MDRHAGTALLVLAALVSVTGCAWDRSLNHRLDRLETVVKYNHERISTLEEARGQGGPAKQPLDRARTADTRPVMLHFREIHARDPKIVSAVPDLSLFFGSGVSELSTSQKDKLRSFLAHAAGSRENGLSLTLNGFSSRGADPNRDHQLSASRCFSVYNFMLKASDVASLREVHVNACGVHFATGKRRHDRRVDLHVNGRSRAEGGT
jgi:outer membrane protein OmpA-like peptidoglycan-associated protein